MSTFVFDFKKKEFFAERALVFLKMMKKKYRKTHEITIVFDWMEFILNSKKIMKKKNISLSLWPYYHFKGNVIINSLIFFEEYFSFITKSPYGSYARRKDEKKYKKIILFYYNHCRTHLYSAIKNVRDNGRYVLDLFFEVINEKKMEIDSKDDFIGLCFSKGYKLNDLVLIYEGYRSKKVKLAYFLGKQGFDEIEKYMKKIGPTSNKWGQILSMEEKKYEFYSILHGFKKLYPNSIPSFEGLTQEQLDIICWRTLDLVKNGNIKILSNILKFLEEKCFDTMQNYFYRFLVQMRPLRTLYNVLLDLEKSAKQFKYHDQVLRIIVEELRIGKEEQFTYFLRLNSFNIRTILDEKWSWIYDPNFKTTDLIASFYSNIYRHFYDIDFAFKRIKEKNTIDSSLVLTVLKLSFFREEYLYKVFDKFLLRKLY